MGLILTYIAYITLLNVYRNFIVYSLITVYSQISVGFTLTVSRQASQRRVLRELCATTWEEDRGGARAALLLLLL